MIRADTAPEVSGTQSIERAVGLLRLLAATRNRGASLSELVETSGLMKPTCRRILLALIDAGLAEQNAETRRYFLGAETYVLGTIAADRFGIHRLGLDSVERLARETGDAAFLQVRRDWSVVCMHREDGDYPIRSHVLAVGDRHPLGVGAGGIALLAALPEAEASLAIDMNASILRDNYPHIPLPLLNEQAEEARATGWSINRGTVFPQSWGLAMVVRDVRGQPTACLSLAALESRMQPERQPELVRLLQEEVRRLEIRLREFAMSHEGARSEDMSTQSVRRSAGHRR